MKNEKYIRLKVFLDELSESRGVLIIGIVAILTVAVDAYLGAKIIEVISFWKILVELAESCIAAYIFYIFQIQIPNIKERLNAYKVLYEKLSSLELEIDYFIAFVDALTDVSNDVLTIKGMDENGILHFRRSQNNVNVNDYKNVYKYFRSFFVSWKKACSSIKEHRSYAYLNEHIKKTIDEICMKNFNPFSEAMDIYYDGQARVSGLLDFIEWSREISTILSKQLNTKNYVKIKPMNDYDVEIKTQIFESTKDIRKKIDEIIINNRNKK